MWKQQTWRKEVRKRKNWGKERMMRDVAKEGISRVVGGGSQRQRHQEVLREAKPINAAKKGTHSHKTS